MLNGSEWHGDACCRYCRRGREKDSHSLVCCTAAVLSISVGEYWSYWVILNTFGILILVVSKPPKEI